MNSVLSMGELLGWALSFAAFIAVVLVLFFVVSRVTRVILGPRRPIEEELGLEVLRKRLARGEITKDEFEQAKRALGL
jgi:uncharacterized membrane protein